MALKELTKRCATGSATKEIDTISFAQVHRHSDAFTNQMHGESVFDLNF